MIDVFKREATILNNLHDNEFVMRLYGGCYDSFESTANIVEYLERYHVAVQEKLGWNQRVQVSIDFLFHRRAVAHRD